MAEQLTPEICIVGGGPGGVTAALAAATAHVSVVLVEKAKMGGANLAYGAVPSQALMAAASVHEALRRGPALGVTGAPLQVNLTKVAEHVAAVSDAVAANVSPERLTALGVKVIGAAARFVDRETIAADETTIRARYFILAVGSVPVVSDVSGIAYVDAMTADRAFDLGRKINHLIVLGASHQGLELAQAYARLGIHTTILDSGPVLPDHDPELAEIVVDRLRAEGIRVRTGVSIQSVGRRRGGIRFTVNDPEAGEIAVDGSHLLAATGRAPAIDGLGLAAAGIAHDQHGINVDSALRTTNRRVYAVGDVVTGAARAARAAHQANAVVQRIVFGSRTRYDAAAVPLVTWSDPALAAVGLSETEARRRHGGVRVLRFPFAENDRAQAERAPEGIIKVVASRQGRLLGAAIVGRDAGELIAPWSLAIANRLQVGAMQSLPVPYPSRSEIARRVAASFGQPGLTSRTQRRIIEILRKFG